MEKTLPFGQERADRAICRVGDWVRADLVRRWSDGDDSREYLPDGVVTGEGLSFSRITHSAGGKDFLVWKRIS